VVRRQGLEPRTRGLRAANRRPPAQRVQVSSHCRPVLLVQPPAQARPQSPGLPADVPVRVRVRTWAGQVDVAVRHETSDRLMNTDWVRVLPLSMPTLKEVLQRQEFQLVPPARQH
jgi:hypothetical protein